LGALALIVSRNKIGLYLGIFTTSVIGILQAVVHTEGFIKEGGKAKNIVAGFYSSIVAGFYPSIPLNFWSNTFILYFTKNIVIRKDNLT